MFYLIMVTMLTDLSTFHPFPKRFQLVGNMHACTHTQDFFFVISFNMFYIASLLSSVDNILLCSVSFQV